MGKKAFGSCFFTLILMLSVFASASCHSGDIEDRFDYTERNFKVEISGFIDENEVFATLYSIPGTIGDESRAMIKFHSPRALDGITVSVSKKGEYSARLGSAAVSCEWAQEIFEPFLPVIERGEIYSVRKNESGGADIRICDENCDLIYVFKQDSDAPSRIYGKISGRSIDLSLQNFVFDFDLEK